MTVKELFKNYSDGACVKVSIHDTGWKYLETPEGDTVFWVNLSEPDDNLKTLQKVFDSRIYEWWVHVNSGTLHIHLIDSIY